MIKFYPHQEDALEQTKGRMKCAHYLKMGLGKTFTGAEQMVRLAAEYNLLVCQKSKVGDWINHFTTYYPHLNVTDYTKKDAEIQPGVIVINYELVWRRPEFKKMSGFTLMLDESSKIMHDTAKVTKFIKKLNYDGLILLSGTPCGGRYELFLSQIHMLGWLISKSLFYKQYCVTESFRTYDGMWHKQVVGYKNIERLKSKLANYGAVFMETEDAIALPDVNDQVINITPPGRYRQFLKDRVSIIDGEEIIGDTPLKTMLGCRKICAYHNEDKFSALADLVESTDDRIIVFYNFTAEYVKAYEAVKYLNRPVSAINGRGINLTAYDNCDRSITFVQYQAGAMGLNLQLARRIVYLSPPLQWELFDQSKARIRRIGQEKTCFYYYLTTTDSVEEKIYKTLKKRKDFDEILFLKECIANE